MPDIPLHFTAEERALLERYAQMRGLPLDEAVKELMKEVCRKLRSERPN